MPSRAGAGELSVDDLRALIREIPDFPKPGILFYDITTLLKDASAYHRAVDLMTEPYLDQRVDKVVGMESRGFIFSAPMAYGLDAGFVPVRKLGKLPAETGSVEYALEYGTNTLEIHKDAISKGERVLIVDDLLATGGTVTGTIELVQRLEGKVVGLAFLVRRFRGMPAMRQGAVLDTLALKAMFALNLDIMIRSFVLLAAFALLTRQGAQLGTLTLAANAVLMNFFLLAGYLLDGFATAAEQIAGRIGWYSDPLGDISDLTFGIGLNWKSLALDFGNIPQAKDSGLDYVKKITLGYRF